MNVQRRYTLAEVSELSGRSHTSLYRDRDRGWLVIKKHGRKSYVEESDLEAYLTREHFLDDEVAS